MIFLRYQLTASLALAFAFFRPLAPPSMARDTRSCYVSRRKGVKEPSRIRLLGDNLNGRGLKRSDHGGAKLQIFSAFVKYD